MEKPGTEGRFQNEIPASAAPADAMPALQTTITRTYAWWLVLGLVGLDCFSTLGYLPTIAAEGAEERAPLAALAVSMLILFAALPVYLYIVGRSPHGRGATGLLEKHLSGWSGKLFILFLLGFVATDFVMTRTLSTADASKHLLANAYARSGVEWMLDRKEIIQDALPPALQGEWTDRFFDWLNDQLIVTVVLVIIGFALYFFLLRGFTRGFVYAAAVIVALFLAVNGIVIGSCLLYLSRHPQYLKNWTELIGFASREQTALDLLFDFAALAIRSLPALALGLSGFELSMTVAPLVRGRAEDDPAHPRGRIRNMRKLLIATALIMAVLVPTSVASVKFLVPPGMMEEQGSAHGLARHRALAYLAHGGALHPPGKRFGTDTPSEQGREFEDPEKREGLEVPPEENAQQRQVEEAPRATFAKETGADLNPLFGPVFGTLYDVSAVLILFLAGASVTISLRDLLPQYLARYGMEMHWAQRIGVLMHLFNLIVLIVVLAFHASVSHQQGAYASAVLVLLAGATLAAIIDMRSRSRRRAMRVLDALALTLLLMVTGVVLAGVTDTQLLELFVVIVELATAIWAAVDSSRLELHKYRGGIGHPILVFLAVLILWPICFPLYLVTRSRRIAGELKLKEKYRDDMATPLDASRYFFPPFATVPLFVVCLIFLFTAIGVGYDNPAGVIIALLFVVVVFVMAALSRWMRSTELRYYGFTFADEESGIRWEQIRRLEFQVLVPHRPDDRTLAEKEAEIRARHRLGTDVPIIFIEAELGDPSDFQHQPLMQIVKENGREIIRVSQCPSIAHALAAIALEFREVGRPPEIHFAWSGESPLASNLNFLLWGHGNVPWLVHALVCKTEPDPTRQPRVVIG
jgi:hypothetical protein